MAKAEKVSERVVTVTERVTLCLSIQEAEFLASLLRHVAGSEGNSPRRHQTAISTALRAAGVQATSYELAEPGRFLRVEAIENRRHVESLFDGRYVGKGVRYNDFPHDWTESERG